MKRLLWLLMFPASVHAGSDLDFKTETAEYKLFETSVSGFSSKSDTTVIALWEMSNPTRTIRVKVTTIGCGKPFGVMTFAALEYTHHYNWSLEGQFAYDWIAAASCVAYISKNPNAKLVK